MRGVNERLERRRQFRHCGQCFKSLKLGESADASGFRVEAVDARQSLRVKYNGRGSRTARIMTIVPRQFRSVGFISIADTNLVSI